MRNRKISPKKAGTMLLFKVKSLQVWILQGHTSPGIPSALFQSKAIFKYPSSYLVLVTLVTHLLCLRQPLHDSRKELGEWLISMHSCISWQHWLISTNLEPKAWCCCTTLVHYTELQRLSTSKISTQIQVHIYSIDVRQVSIYIIYMYKLNYLLKTHANH